MEYTTVQYQHTNYCVCRYGESNNQLFVIDAKFMDQVTRWGDEWEDHNNRVASPMMNIGDKIMRCHIDRIVMRKKMHDLKEKNSAANYTIKYKNGNYRDIRKNNLEVIYLNTMYDKTIPEGLTTDNIPLYISYDTSNEQFVIKIVHGKKTTKIYGIRSNELSINGKLEQAKMKLIEFAEKNPDINEEKNLLQNYTYGRYELMKEFNEIIKLSRFDCINDNLMDVPEKNIITANLKSLSKSDRDIINNSMNNKDSGRRCTTKLPDGCTVKVKDIPEYCYYKPAKGNRRDCFYIKDHPIQKKAGNRNEIRTNGSKKMTTDEKFEQLLQLLYDLEQTAD